MSLAMATSDCSRVLKTAALVFGVVSLSWGLELKSIESFGVKPEMNATQIQATLTKKGFSRKEYPFKSVANGAKVEYSRGEEHLSIFTSGEVALGIASTLVKIGNQQIRRGDKRETVVRILGKPSSVDKEKSGATVYHYRDESIQRGMGIRFKQNFVYEIEFGGW